MKDPAFDVRLCDDCGAGLEIRDMIQLYQAVRMSYICPACGLGVRVNRALSDGQESALSLDRTYQRKGPASSADPDRP